MAQIAPGLASSIAGDTGGQFASTSGQSVNQAQGAETIQGSTTSAYGSASPVNYTAQHLYPSNVVPYTSSSLSGANVLPATQALPPAPSGQSQPSTPVPSSAKRKQHDDSASASAPPRKRRLPPLAMANGEGSNGGALDREDVDVGPHGGPKHWTDSEKTSLFNWLLVHDKHWDMFRTKMNTVFRDASTQIFGGRKSFTALKSCYHRNVETFKQIFAFEVFLARSPPDPSNSSSGPASLSEHDDPTMARQAYLEQRLEEARAAGAPVANLNMKVIDHWHQNGWYNLFKSRFREDPRTGLPVPFYGPSSMSFPDGPPANHLAYPSTAIDPQLTNGEGDGDDEEEEEADEQQPEELLQAVETAGSGVGAAPGRPFPLEAQQISRSVAPTSEQVQVQAVQALNHLTTVTQSLVDQCGELMQLLRAEAEERKARSQVQGEKMFGRREDGLNRKEKAALATEMLANADVGDEVRKAAADYLKRLFMSE